MCPLPVGRLGLSPVVAGFVIWRRDVAIYDGHWRAAVGEEDVAQAPAAARTPPGGGVSGCGARPMLQAAKRAGAAAIGDAAASEGLVPDRDANTPEHDGPPEPDWRRLLDGYAEPGRVRRLRDRQRQEAARRGWLRRWLWRVLRRRSG